MISMFGITDRGMLRRANQDACAYESVAARRAWGVVCDGMGGARAGDIASRIGVEVFKEHMQAYYAEARVEASSVVELEAAVEEGNEAILFVANRNREYFGMGTTLVGIIIEDDEVFIINIGDSRAYHISEGEIHRVTRDHSVVEALVARGNITPEQARIHPQKNLITRALGTSKTAQPDIYTLSVKEDDWILLCSDGLINELLDEEILEELQSCTQTEEACHKLLDMALERGAADNVTVLLFHVESKE